MENIFIFWARGINQTTFIEKYLKSFHNKDLRIYVNTPGHLEVYCNILMLELEMMLVMVTGQFRPLNNSDPPNSHPPYSDPSNSDPSRFRQPEFRPLLIQTPQFRPLPTQTPQIQTPPDSDPLQFRPLPIQTPPILTLKVESLAELKFKPFFRSK